MTGIETLKSAPGVARPGPAVVQEAEASLQEGSCLEGATPPPKGVARLEGGG